MRSLGRLAIAEKMSHKLLLFEASLRLLSCCRVCVLRGVLLPTVFDGGGEVFDARGSVTKPSCSPGTARTNSPAADVDLLVLLVLLTACFFYDNICYLLSTKKKTLQVFFCRIIIIWIYLVFGQFEVLDLALLCPVYAI